MKMPEWPIPLGAKPIDLGLHRMFQALEILENPHHKMPPVIHVAGTNGKGSTIAFLKAMLNAAGKKCHVYTSPHLVEFNERIVLADNQISDEDINEALDVVRENCEGMNLTFFEATTLAAMLAFSVVKADYVLLETGLGGRLDASNIMGQNGAPNPILTIITPVSFDHMEFLGHDIASIAAEKAAIIKPNTPCIVSKQLPEAAKVIADEAAVKNSPAYFLGKDFSYKIENDGSFIFKTSDINLKLPAVSLAGMHQYINAATAVRAAIELDLSKTAIALGLQAAKWPARLEKIEPNIYLDGGHNEDAARIIAEFIRDENKKNLKRNIAIIGMLKTKDYKTFMKNISESFDEIIAVPITKEDYRDPEELIAACENPKVRCSIADSVGIAISQSKGKNNRVVICGSLYLAGQVLGERSA